jgi:hypothetical protein
VKRSEVLDTAKEYVTKDRATLENAVQDGENVLKW